MTAYPSLTAVIHHARAWDKRDTHLRALAREPHTLHVQAVNRSLAYMRLLDLHDIAGDMDNRLPIPFAAYRYQAHPSTLHDRSEYAQSRRF